MSEAGYLTNQFLVAMPTMADANFAQTVTFIWEHNHEGALGIIINRPLQMRLAEVFDQLKMPMSPGVSGVEHVLQGGPVQTDRGFVVHHVEAEGEPDRDEEERDPEAEGEEPLARRGLAEEVEGDGEDGPHAAPGVCIF